MSNKNNNLEVAVIVTIEICQKMFCLHVIMSWFMTLSAPSSRPIVLLIMLIIGIPMI